MSSIKYPMASFLEIDDLMGGRKVVMVCRDGVTYLDLMDPEITPIVIDPVLNPVELGTFADFGNSYPNASRRLLAAFRSAGDPRVDSDPIYTMRVLWFAVQRGGDECDEAAIRWAQEQARQQEETIKRLHEQATEFVGSVAVTKKD